MFEAGAALDDMGNRLEVDSTFGAMGGFAMVKAGCVGVNKRVAGDESDQSHRVCPAKPRWGASWTVVFGRRWY